MKKSEKRGKNAWDWDLSPRGAHAPKWFPARTGLEGHLIQSGLELGRGFLASTAVFGYLLFSPGPRQLFSTQVPVPSLFAVSTAGHFRPVLFFGYAGSDKFIYLF